MLLVLDSNEYLFAFGKPESSSESLFEALASSPDKFQIRIVRTILEEIQRNISENRFKEIFRYLDALGVFIDEDWEVPFELGMKYRAMNFKTGDAFIAAYTEWAGAACLVTENRDFLQSASLPFKVLRAEKFLKEYT